LVGLAGGAGPLDDSALSLPHLPVGLMLHHVVAFAEASEVREGGASALCEGVRVIDVGFSCRRGAPREPAGEIPPDQGAFLPGGRSVMIKVLDLPGVWMVENAIPSGGGAGEVS